MMPTLAQYLSDPPQGPLDPFRNRFASQTESPLPGVRAHVCENPESRTSQAFPIHVPSDPAPQTFRTVNTRVNELWQTDFTYFKIIGWGWYYLSTILDDDSRYIIAWRLCSGMAATDVQNTLDDALAFTGLDQVEVNHKPQLLSDHGPCYVSGELSDYLEQQGMTHTRGAPYHPQTQGKIERWRRSMKNQILLNHYYLPSELQEHLQRFISYYNHERYHESLDNLTPADVFYGRDQDILEQRQQIKHNTMSMRRKMVYDNRNNLTNLMS